MCLCKFIGAMCGAISVYEGMEDITSAVYDTITAMREENGKLFLRQPARSSDAAMDTSTSTAAPRPLKRKRLLIVISM